jgi:hypothetical protein
MAAFGAAFFWRDLMTAADDSCPAPIDIGSCRALHTLHTIMQKEKSMRAVLITALMLMPLPAIAQNETPAKETPAQKLRYLRDLKGNDCSADAITLKSAPGGAIRYTIKEAFLEVIGGKLDEAGNQWAQVRNNNNKSQIGWVPLDTLSCI